MPRNPSNPRKPNQATWTSENNPRVGKPKGTKNRTTLFKEEIASAFTANDIIVVLRKMQQMALGATQHPDGKLTFDKEGNPHAAKLFLEYTVGRPLVQVAIHETESLTLEVIDLERAIQRQITWKRGRENLKGLEGDGDNGQKTNGDEAQAN